MAESRPTTDREESPDTHTLRERVEEFESKLKGMVERHWKGATKHGKRDLAPMFHFLLRSGDEHVIGVQLGDVSAKNAVADFVRRYGKSHDAIAVAHISEAWIAAARPGDGGFDDFKGTPPSEREDRREILFANVETPYGCHMHVWDIDRTGKRAKLAKYFKGEDIRSRFFGAIEKLN